MSEWLATHAYFTETCVLFLLGFSTVFILPRHRRLLVLSGVMCIPGALISLLHSSDFWMPEFTVFFVTSPEDVLWTCYSGMGTGFFAILPWHRRIESRTRWSAAWLRLGLIMAAFALLLVLLLWTFPGAGGVMLATLLAMSGVGAGLLWTRPDGWRLAVAGSAGFTLIHWLDVVAFTRIWPHTKSYWNPGAQLPWQLYGVPGYEIVWAAVFGFVWPLILARTCDVRIRPAAPGCMTAASQR